MIEYLNHAICPSDFSNTKDDWREPTYGKFVLKITETIVPNLPEPEHEQRCKPSRRDVEDYCDLYIRQNLEMQYFFSS